MFRLFSFMLAFYNHLYILLKSGLDARYKVGALEVIPYFPIGSLHLDHGLWTTNEGINQRKCGPIWQVPDVADKKCFSRT